VPENVTGLERTMVADAFGALYLGAPAPFTSSFPFQRAIPMQSKLFVVATLAMLAGAAACGTSRTPTAVDLVRTETSRAIPPAGTNGGMAPRMDNGGMAGSGGYTSPPPPPNGGMAGSGG